MNDWASPWASATSPPLGTDDRTQHEDSWKDQSGKNDSGNDAQWGVSQGGADWAEEDSVVGINGDAKNGKDTGSRKEEELQRAAHPESHSNVEHGLRLHSNGQLGPPVSDGELWHSGAIDGEAGNVWGNFEGSLGDDAHDALEHGLPESDNLAALNIPHKMGKTPPTEESIADILDWEQSPSRTSFIHDTAQVGMRIEIEHNAGTVDMLDNQAILGLDPLDSETYKTYNGLKPSLSLDEGLNNTFEDLSEDSVKDMSNDTGPKSFTSSEHSDPYNGFGTSQGRRLDVEDTGPSQLQAQGSIAPSTLVDELRRDHYGMESDLEDGLTLRGDFLLVRASDAPAEVSSSSNSLRPIEPLSNEIKGAPQLSESALDVTRGAVVPGLQISNEGAEDDFGDFEDFAFAIEDVPTNEMDNSRRGSSVTVLDKTSDSKPVHAEKDTVMQRLRDMSRQAEVFISEYLKADDELNSTGEQPHISQPSEVQANDGNVDTSLSETSMSSSPLHVDAVTFRTTFELREIAMEALFPSITSKADPLEEPPRELLSTTSSRKMWHRISRLGTLRAYDSGDVNDYVRVTWPQSAIKKKVLGTVSRWVAEDRMNHGAVLFGASSNPYGPSFSWTDKPAPETTTIPRIQPIEPPKLRQRRRSSVVRTVPASDDLKRFSWSTVPANGERAIVAEPHESPLSVSVALTPLEPPPKSSTSSASLLWMDTLIPQTHLSPTVPKTPQLPFPTGDVLKNKSFPLEDQWGDFEAFESASVVSQIPGQPATLLTPTFAKPSTPVSPNNVPPFMPSTEVTSPVTSKPLVPKWDHEKPSQSLTHNNVVSRVQGTFEKSSTTGKVHEADDNWADFESFETPRSTSIVTPSTTLAIAASEGNESMAKPLTPLPRFETPIAMDVLDMPTHDISHDLAIPVHSSKVQEAEGYVADLESFEAAQPVSVHATPLITANSISPSIEDVMKSLPTMSRSDAIVTSDVEEIPMILETGTSGTYPVSTKPTSLPEQQETLDDWGEFEAFDSGGQAHETVEPVPLALKDDSWLTDLPPGSSIASSKSGLGALAVFSEKGPTTDTSAPLGIPAQHPQYDPWGGLGAFDSVIQAVPTSISSIAAPDVLSDAQQPGSSSQSSVNTLETQHKVLSAAERVAVEKLVQGLPDFTYMLR